jgi:hypothetical protein
VAIKRVNLLRARETSAVEIEIVAGPSHIKREVFPKTAITLNLLSVSADCTGMCRERLIVPTILALVALAAASAMAQAPQPGTGYPAERCRLRVYNTMPINGHTSRRTAIRSMQHSSIKTSVFQANRSGFVAGSMQQLT